MLTLPNNAKKLLLHCCCAPCCGGIIERLLDSGITMTVFFYNPNIDTKEEYERRKIEVVRFCQKNNVPFFDGDYDQNLWIKNVTGLEKEPERGKRCSVCFDMRLVRSALYAQDNGFNLFATSLSISRWKDINQVHASGRRAASQYPNLLFWDFNWRKEGGQQKSLAVTAREHFYQQNYCGCVYSTRALKP
ncbi:MAG: epoxyqueuosine reductase QueH [Candidatus Omnitrophica bacterium]|nr:epoxyqueuosine reductase QueH [Candidatus Omnitrophota bacterium]